MDREDAYTHTAFFIQHENTMYTKKKVPGAKKLKSASNYVTYYHIEQQTSQFHKAQHPMAPI